METIPLNAIGNELGPDMDLFICSASFEARSSAVPESILKNGASGPHTTLVFCNDEFLNESQEPLRVITHRDANVVVKYLRADDPIFTADVLNASVREAWPQSTGGKVHVAVDITAFTRECLLMLMSVLWSLKVPADMVRLLYLKADEYDVGADWAKKWLSHGIKEVRSVVGYAGNLLPSKPTHLIVMAGFESERAVQLILECEPTFVSLGVADPENEHATRHRLANEACLRRVRSFIESANSFTFDGYDPGHAAAALLAQIDVVSEESNTVIAPMNTKISTVGAAVAAARMPSVQLVYAQADVYNYSRYSRAGDVVFCFDLPRVSGPA